MTRKVARNARMEARLAPETLALVKRAAELQGRSLSDFVVAAAQEAAKRAIEHSHVIGLSIGDQTLFVDLLVDPPQPNATLTKAAYAALILESR